jgi:phosphatidylserine/phosphatidylglycerophosphate/cardiolipin synthase-like enzyme
VDELKNANNSVYFATFTFTSKPIAETLIDLHNKGVKVKGIYEKRQNSTWCTYKMLDEAGIDVIWDENPKTMHHKFFIIDNTTTITGSYNPTKHANTANDENILIIHNDNISNEYVNEFFKRWNEWQPTSSLKPILISNTTPSSSYTSAPGFDWAIAIVGLLAVAYTLMKRREV